MIMLPIMQTVTTTPNEWEAGVVLAFLAFFITFFVLSVLAIAIYVSSQILQKRKRKVEAAKTLEPTTIVPSEGTEKIDFLEMAAAIAAVKHYLVLKGSALKRTMGLTPQSAWLISWLNEASRKEVVNPYLLKKNSLKLGGRNDGK